MLQFCYIVAFLLIKCIIRGLIMNRRSGLLTQFATIFILFAVVIVIAASAVTYFIQMRTYRELCADTIKDVGDYLAELIKEDADDFVNYTEYYSEHFEEIRIPCDFDEYLTARNTFMDAFTQAYPDKTLYSDISVSDLSDELQLLYYTYRQEYWILTFEQARESFNLPYTYFLTLNDEKFTNVYMIDGERTEDSEHPGYLYMGDEYYEDPETHPLLWETWYTGEKQDEVFEWDNEWGNTYSYYTPLVIDGKTLGLVVAEIDVEDVNRDILSNSVTLGARMAGLFFVGILLILFIINGVYITKIHYLAGKIEDYGTSRDRQIVEDIKHYNFGNSEIGVVADKTVDMIDEIESHEQALERAARMKTDFLANMSHEIRTPMNSVIGLAEMTLREDLNDRSRNYVGQIKSSGRILLEIINDILDFSKIESGNLDIVPIDYIPASLFNDVSNIIMMRLQGRDVEFDLQVSPTLPASLYGDNIRIRQILINLATNAVKFTESGSVTIHADYEKRDESSILMTISVTDTGIGIKQEDLENIFESFSQVDSKRNRSVEGTGLGLAISQQLVNLMGGTLSVKSEFGKGSTFSFTVPQKVTDWTPSVKVKEPDRCVALSLFESSFKSANFKRDSSRLGVITYTMDPGQDLNARYEEIKKSYPGLELFLFLENSQLTPEHVEFIRNNPEVTAVLVTDFGTRNDQNLSNLIHINNPISTLIIAMVYNHETVFYDEGQIEDTGDFTAPTASVLIVDDNAVNLTVAEGLLEPLNMKIMTADSGKEALSMTSRHDYDIVLMDHMMPEMDGIETTELIRKENPKYNDIPIIALTANAMSDAREKFLQAGMDDFIAKPIEVHNLISKIKHWLPPEKIKPLTEEEEISRKMKERIKDSVKEDFPVIGDLDTQTAITMIGGKKLFYDLIGMFRKFLEPKHKAILDAYNAENWPEYTIEVHALKSASKQIGAMELSDMAASLEKAGKENDIEYIKANTDALLDRYMSYKSVLDPYVEKEEDPSDKEPANPDTLKELFGKLKSAADELDLDGMEEAAASLNAYSYPEEQAGLLEELKEAVGNIDTDSCLEIISKWEEKL